MSQDPLIIFVCEHGAAKSILAAAYFNELAREENINMRAIARGTHPDAELSSKTIAGLQEDGLAPTESIPARLTREEIESARRIICFCELPDEYPQETIVEGWLDIPPVSEGYERSRDAIVSRLHKLIHNL
jgi:protein-tyrosine-phosphatase